MRVSVSIEILFALYACISVAICILSVYCLVTFFEIRLSEAQRKRRNLERKIMGKSKKRYIDYYAKFAHKDIPFWEDVAVMDQQHQEPKQQQQESREQICVVEETAATLKRNHFKNEQPAWEKTATAPYLKRTPLLLAKGLPFIQQQQDAIVINCRSMAAAALSSGFY